MQSVDTEDIRMPNEQRQASSGDARQQEVTRRESLPQDPLSYATPVSTFPQLLVILHFYAVVLNALLVICLCRPDNRLARHRRSILPVSASCAPRIPLGVLLTISWLPVTRQTPSSRLLCYPIGDVHTMYSLLEE